MMSRLWGKRMTDAPVVVDDINSLREDPTGLTVGGIAAPRDDCRTFRLPRRRSSPAPAQCARGRASSSGADGSAGLVRHDLRDARPIGHLHTDDQHVLAVLGTEDPRLAFVYVPPTLAQRLEDVRLVRDQQRVGAR